MSRPVILEVALNGFTVASTNPALPRTPEEVAADGLRCLDAGASILHSHLDAFALGPEAAAERYHAAYRRILDARPDAILYPTIGFGETIADRYGHHDRLAAAGVIRAGLLDPGSVNLGSIGLDGAAGGAPHVGPDAAPERRVADGVLQHAQPPGAARVGVVRPEATSSSSAPSSA